MKLKRHAAAASLLLLEAAAWAAKRQIQATPEQTIPQQIMQSGVCMVTECGVFSLLFIIVPALAVYIYRTYIRLGI